MDLPYFVLEDTYEQQDSSKDDRKEAEKPKKKNMQTKAYKKHI